MSLRNLLKNKIFTATNQSFNDLSLEIFRYQYENNPVYQRYCSLMKVNPSEIFSMYQIPFLPIEIFKTHKVITGNLPVEKIFKSSGTTGNETSRHHVSDLNIYEESFFKSFEIFFGDVKKFCVLALLPSYLERTDSSLVYMADHLMKKSNHAQGNFFLSDTDGLLRTLDSLEKIQQPALLIGVSFALLDLVEKKSLHLHHTLIMETGGMKGRREEITREALHMRLKKGFGTDRICSEYGMTELLSQAYFMDDGKFHSPSWMRVFIRDVNDPLQLSGNNITGGINVIDLANIDSCSFIATSDLGKSFEDGSFDVLGRMDYSDLRGCNLIWEG